MHAGVGERERRRERTTTTATAAATTKLLLLSHEKAYHSGAEVIFGESAELLPKCALSVVRNLEHCPSHISLFTHFRLVLFIVPAIALSPTIALVLLVHWLLNIALAARIPFSRVSIPISGCCLRRQAFGCDATVPARATLCVISLFALLGLVLGQGVIFSLLHGVERESESSRESSGERVQELKSSRERVQEFKRVQESSREQEVWKRMDDQMRASEGRRRGCAVRLLPAVQEVRIVRTCVYGWGWV
jgi:hypothetical protein